MHHDFMFATGIENSYPVIEVDGRPKRIDQMQKCGHYERWREDFELVREMGIEYLRYGPPYYQTHLGPGQYDWSFTDETFQALYEMGITPIVDLCHFGTPDWLGATFQNREWPQFFAEYAKAFAERYPWIRLFTPVNEIFIAAQFSAQFGWWNERLCSDVAYVTALHNLCKANVMAMRAIRSVRPNATFIQSESSEYFHSQDPHCEPYAYFLNHKRFLPLDLTYGREINAMMYEYLLDHGMTREDYQWFRDNNVRGSCVMGNDYYWTNEHSVCADRAIEPSGEVFGYYVITKQYFDRYRLPVMHTETNTTTERSVEWLRKEWANLHRLKLDGVPILGFTWYSLTDQIDWDVALREENNRVHTVGLYDLDRKIRPVGEAYKKLIAQWGGILPTASATLRPFL
ncbi:family 1 glycosylhydrolase [Fimbriimonas ginsengisoli]|uniref:Glycoside hydrolase n=1 Tax=Fimbriimonas ginsengisoli Gsoil 348 TaxID=661478 RepID=A0A068NUX7_FIMGI|nr:family 1 glycosylhydrolase [Fimbriimonas ginsengisoli]AIE87256.1 glycoside hydrolase [Fimbriimonas ginsengisoli Gsoil 348]